MKDKEKTKEQLIEDLKALRLELRKHEASRAEFAKATKEFLLLQTLLVVITGSEDFESAINVILSRVCETTGWDYGEAWIPLSDKKLLTCSTAHFIRSKAFQKFRIQSENIRFSPGTGLPGRVWSIKRPEWIPDIPRRTPDFFLRAKDALKVGLKAGYAIPIIADDNVLAVLAFYMKKSQKKDERLVSFISGIASELGAVLKLTRINEQLRSEIDERKRAEQELKASEKKYKVLFEENIDATLVAEAKTGIIIDCNKSAVKLLDRRKSELIGSHQRTLHPPVEIDGDFSRTYKQHVSDKKGKVLGTQVITKDGKIKDVEIKANIFDLKGQKLIQGVFHDITKRKRVEDALRESEERFRFLYDNNPSMYFTLDRDGKVLSVNKYGANKLGYTVEELTGYSVLKVFHKEDRTAVQEKLANSLKFPGKINHWEFRKVCKDKTVIWVKETIRVIKNNKDETNVLVVCEDITERKLAEENLENQLTFLQTLMDTIPSPIFYKDAKGRYMGCNRAFEKVLGLRINDILGKTVYDVAPKKLADAYFKQDAALFGKPGVQMYEYPVRYSDGTEHNVIFNKATYLRTDGKIAGLVGIMTDITDRIKAEQTLKREKEKLYTILDMVPGMVYLQAPDYKIRFANKQFIKQYGEPKEKLCHEVIWDRKKPCKICPTFRVFETRKPEIWISDHEATGRLYQVHDYPFVDNDGTMLVLEVSIDITDQKRIEDDLKLKSNELETLNKDLRDLSAQLSKNDEMSRKKFATILHEQVGQNLAALKIKCADIIKENTGIKPKMKDVIAEMIVTLDDTIDSARELTSDLYPVVLDRLGFVTAVSWYGDIILKPKGIKVKSDIDEFVETLSSGYKLSLFRIIQEAFHNIVKHSSATFVEIELIKTDGSIRLKIKDNGIGFNSEKVRKKKSRGIGIMLMKERALSLAGHFEIKSDGDSGTSLIIEIPL